MYNADNLTVVIYFSFGLACLFFNRISIKLF